ncbi:hypothetical protein NHH73_20060 [Oxalobacteraceae bacterium OTU3CINTB1]|nr:hypothetical protein NHH73_20060 [Oxalobacteraceae bacterium OTU3CINTB1]
MEQATADAWRRPAAITAQYIQYCFDTQPKAGTYTNYSWVEITLICAGSVTGLPIVRSQAIDGGGDALDVTLFQDFAVSQGEG